MIRRRSTQLDAGVARAGFVPRPVRGLPTHWNQRKSWWTRTQSIRTAGALQFEVALVETLEPPVYQRIALKALHLRELGLSDRAIAGRLGVTDKTIAKAIGWVQSPLAE